MAALITRRFAAPLASALTAPQAVCLSAPMAHAFHVLALGSSSAPSAAVAWDMPEGARGISTKRRRGKMMNKHKYKKVCSAPSGLAPPWCACGS